MGNIVRLPVDSTAIDGYLALPGGAGPGVIVLQEWWGLVPHIKSVADRFAAEGFVALAPDLFHGRTATSADEAGKLMMALEIDEAERDMRGAIHYLRERPEVTGNRVGSVGFCMGGALSLFAASTNLDVGACVVFYGGHPNVKPDLPKLQAPVLGLYAEQDGFVTPAVVRELEMQLTTLGKRHEIHTYPGVDHAFFNDQRLEVYNGEASQDAWRRTIGFLKAELGST